MTLVKVIETFCYLNEYYGAFSTSISNLQGQIQSTIIDTSYKSILTRLYNSEKNLKNHLSKMLPRLCFPNPPHGTELLGAESLQSPTLIVPPKRGSSNTLLLQFRLKAGVHMNRSDI